jgi:hypothetical protein
MAIEYKDRVSDTTATTGTGAFTPAGSAATGFRTIAAASYSTGATLRYACESSDKSEWEVGEGVWNGTTLTRATIYASSNSNNAVSFSAGTKTLMTVPVAEDFMGKAFPLGAIITVPYNGATFTAADGSQWLAAVGTSVAYDAAVHTDLPRGMKTAAIPFPGPLANGGFSSTPNANLSAAYDSANTAWVLAATFGNAAVGFTHYTSTDHGANWTQRTLPNSLSYVMWAPTTGKVWGLAATTTSASITSTDGGASWTTVTPGGAVPSGIVHFASDGASNYIAIAGGGTGGVYTTNGGTAVSTLTLPAAANTAATGPFGAGSSTFNAGASLFVVPSGATAGAYYTSPTGAVWTNRNAQSTFAPYSNFFGAGSVLMASSATVTVAVGNNGFFANTTDGLAWSNHGFISTDHRVSSISSPNNRALWYDGTRFVLLWGDAILYSVAGTTWTLADLAFPFPNATVSGYNNGQLFRTTSGQFTQAGGWRLDDPTLSTPTYVTPPTVGQVLPAATTYYRIK